MKCFVIMPYGNREKDLLRKQELDGLYDHFRRPAVEAVVIPGHVNEHVICHRGDKAPGPGSRAVLKNDVNIEGQANLLNLPRKLKPTRRHRRYATCVPVFAGPQAISTELNRSRTRLTF